METTGHTDTVGTLFTPYEQVAFNDDNDDLGVDRNFQIVADVVREIYHLEVRGHDENTRGDYTLEVQLDDYGNSQAAATPVSVPSSTIGHLEDYRDVDFFSVFLPEAEDLRVQVKSNDPAPISLTLYSQDGMEYYGGTREEIEQRMESGIHHIKVSAPFGFYAPDDDWAARYFFSVSWSPTVFTHRIPLMRPGENVAQTGFVRILNHTQKTGDVIVYGTDDSGQRFGPAVLTMDANVAVHFNSSDLEQGNAQKGLSPGIGNGNGNWWLELETTLDIEPRAYIRTSDGLLASVHESVPAEIVGIVAWEVPVFNPAANIRQQSYLRIVNFGGNSGVVWIDGIDDLGNKSPVMDGSLHSVELTLDAGASTTVTSQELEEGSSRFLGRIGDGSGKWRIMVYSSLALMVLNLMQSPTGHVVNLSR